MNVPEDIMPSDPLIFKSTSSGLAVLSNMGARAFKSCRRFKELR